MIIGVDLDDVLLDFFGTFCGYVNKTCGTSYTRDSHTNFDISISWGWSREDGQQAILDFYHSEDHHCVAPVVGAVEAITQLSKDHTIHIITSKPEFLRGETEKWITKYFPGMISSIHFMNHYHGDGKKRSKADTCKELGVQVFVDDSIEQCRNVSAAGIPVFMPDAPWNREEIGPLVTRAKSWAEIVEKIQSGVSTPLIGVVGGETYTDIDVLACTIAYSELLRLEGRKAEPVIPGVLNASCPPMIRAMPLTYVIKPSDPANEVYVAVDISDRTYLATCATQIWEEYVRRGYAEKISTTSANLLAAAILSNTLNFGAQVTHDRDRAAFESLKKHVDMSAGWEARYFNEVQQISLRGDVESVIKSDTKSLTIPGLGYDIVMGQMELWNGSEFVRTQEALISKVLQSFGPVDWFMSVPSISEGKNYLYCTSDRLKKLLGDIIGATFTGNTGTTDKMWLRKEVRKKLIELK